MSKPQRRKGNAKNASSSAAHLLLANGGTSFVGLAPEMNIFEAVNNVEDTIVQIDDEARIILRKLIKKDPSTREKGLRELLEYLTSTNELIDSCYEHFWGISEQLASDGSPTVRMLTMKVIGMFVEKLKKGASKGLKKIVPAIFFSMHDVSNSVRSAARSAFVNNFPKKQETVEVFGKVAVKMAVEILKGSHDLCHPAKYDAEESSEQRKFRSEDQAMKMIEGFLTSTNSDLGNDEVMTIFEQKDIVKRILGCQELKIKQSFIALCISIPEQYEVLLNPQIYLFIMNSLDSEMGNICEVSWKAFIKMLKNAKFYAKCSFEKTILPRILYLIRQKKTHWIQMGNYLAEAMREIVDNVQIETKVMISILESFQDNLSSETFNELDEQQWARSYKEINEVFMKRQKEVEIVEITAKICEESVKMKNAKAQNCMAEMIEQFLENEWLDRDNLAKLLQLIENNLFGEKYEISSFAEPLLRRGKYTELCPLHLALIDETEKSDRYVMRILLGSDDTYFQNIFEKSGSPKFLLPLAKWPDTESDVIVGIILRLVDLNMTKHLECLKRMDSNDFVSRKLLLACDQCHEIWNVFFAEFSNNTFQSIIESWEEENDGKSIQVTSNVLKRHKIPFKISWNSMNLDCISDVMKSNDFSCCPEVGSTLFYKILQCSEFPSSKHFETLKNITFDSCLRKDFIDFSSVSTCGITDIANRMDKILESTSEENRYLVQQKCLIDESDVENLMDEFAELEVEAMTNSCSVFNEGTLHIEKYSRMNEETFTRLIVCGKIAFFNICLKEPTEYAKKYAAIFLSIIRFCRLRFPFQNLDPLIEELIINIENVQTTTKYNAFNISNVYQNGFAMDAMGIEGIRIELMDSNDIGKNIITVKKYFESDDISFINYIKNGELDADPFDIERHGTPAKTFDSFLFARKCVKISENIMEYLDNYSGDIEYILCGILTVLDALYDQSQVTPFQMSRIYETYLAIYLRAFSNIAKQFRYSNSESKIVEEWLEFYYPTISQLVFNLLGLVKKEDQYSSLPNSILTAIEEIREFPTDLKTGVHLENIFAPELEMFKYSEAERPLIVHSFSLLDSKNPATQIIGLKILKIMMPKMLEIENLECFSKKSEEPNISSEIKNNLNLPILIKQKLDELNDSWNVSVLFLLDVCIMPLEKCNILPDNELRISYSDALWPILKQCLPVLLTYVPPCLARNKVEEYYLQSDINPSPVFIEKYAARLLFRTISCLPASVRLWFRGLPGNVANSLKTEITRHASKLLIDHELEKIRNSKYTTNPDDQELKIRAVTASCEIITEYIVEETKMRLTITFPPEYPLVVPTLDLDKAIVKSDKARKWLLQLNAYLFHQNGSITEGLEMWKKNVDKGVEGAEACTICMMTIHSSTHQLPKVKCKQCKNKFHSNCLYKWFETSNQSSCPLCRANFT